MLLANMFCCDAADFWDYWSAEPDLPEAWSIEVMLPFGPKVLCCVLESLLLEFRCPLIYVLGL